MPFGASTAVELSRVSRIRDTKDRAGGTLAVSAAAWRALLRKTKR
ncbi:DUF397 domain-containing protein [Amycolatopsis balhimycina DSM 5908]|uniref:DUF397 domain-containing protein n=1 Tax=Amycolatopsis balhimycina DSM 5908 TaxID=1081091 RepID=A0A428WIY0_AMYBA|nr:DUF397 domain-containing protein [Amycolatopsis balhimycina]RSM43037.1 DUF397 domain-containing protein [Amycolatopsis balhimycina DSM 5908]